MAMFILSTSLSRNQRGIHRRALPRHAMEEANTGGCHELKLWPHSPVLKIKSTWHRKRVRGWAKDGMEPNLSGAQMAGRNERGVKRGYIVDRKGPSVPFPSR